MAGYAELVNEAPDPTKKEDYSVAQKSMDDIMYDEECRRYALAFDQANQVAFFYAYIKMKEQVLIKFKLGNQEHNLAGINDFTTPAQKSPRMEKDHCSIQSSSLIIMID